MECLNCGKKVKQTKGKRAKQYCNADCRQKHWLKKKKATDPSKRGPGRPPKIVQGNLEKTDSGSVRFVKKEGGKFNFFESGDLPNKVDFVIGFDPINKSKMNPLADEPLKGQLSDPPADLSYTPQHVFALKKNEGVPAPNFNSLLTMAKLGVEDEAAFRELVKSAGLTPNQQSMIHSKLKK